MRLPRLRITVRWMMVFVLVSAFALWSGIAAFRVSYDPRNWLYHDLSRWPQSAADSHVSPFWPRYWRQLAGISWPGSYDCPCEFWSRHKTEPGVTVSGREPIKRKIGSIGHVKIPPREVQHAILEKFSAAKTVPPNSK